MKKLLTLLICCISIYNISYSQEKRGCASYEMHLEHIQTDAKYAEKQQRIEAFTQHYIQTISPTEMTGIITIPIVFHIVHNGDAVGSGENVSESLVLAQLQQLNDDYRKLNSDAGNVPSEFQGDHADLQIEFCLASVDPNGNPTNGIIRHNLSNSSWSRNQIESTLKPQTIWDRNSYLNFWSVRFGGSDSGLLGYAQFPGGAANTDGVVCLYSSVGSLSNPHPDGGSYARGRTGTHEVGHWLNLRHIWGDDGSACTGSDQVSDTPNQGGSYGGSPSYPQSSCGSNDMFMNYMDYVYDTAMNMFTNGQKSRSRSVLAAGGARASLANSNGCSQGGQPTCSDGVQNGDETGVDCGGSSCQPCQTSCSDNSVTVSITLDNYPEETSWTLTNSNGAQVASGGTYGSQSDGSTVVENLCIADGCYTFTINDSYGDGICCSYGSGSYTVTSSDGTVASGGSFGRSESTDFCLGTSGPTCDDGIQNGDETGVDCGGSQCEPCVAAPTCNDGIQNGAETGVDCGGPCAPCAPTGTTVLHEGFFESGLDGWTDGGGDCYRYRGSRSYEGNYSMRLRDNSGTRSAMTLNNLNTSGYDVIEIDFYFYAYSMENGEDFWVRFNDGSGWETVASYSRGSSFQNNNFYQVTLVLNSNDYNFGSGTDFRIQCDASNNSDQVYIDQVTITGVNNGGARLNKNEIRLIETGIDRNILEVNEDENEIGISVYPNPTTSIIHLANHTVDFEDETAQFSIINMVGEVVKSGDLFQSQLNVEELSSGAYLIVITTDTDKHTLKFIKQ